MAARDLTGQTFTRLTVRGLDHIDANAVRFWRCRCRCGAAVIVRGDDLRRGNTRSCGCLHRDTARARGRAAFLAESPPVLTIAGVPTPTRSWQEAYELLRATAATPETPNA